MGTVIFHPCYSAPSFSISSQFRKHPKLRASIFFFKGIADGSRESFPHLKVSCKILDVNGESDQADRRIRPSKKISLRNKTPNIKESDINALVRQVQSSLRKETGDTKLSEETDAKKTPKGMAAKKTPKERAESSDRRNSVPVGSSGSKSPAAKFWENHLLSRKQVSAEETPAKEWNGALEKLFHSNEKILNHTPALDLVSREPEKQQTAGRLKLAQMKKKQIIANTKASHAPENQAMVDLRSARPRSNFMKRSPISPPPVNGKEIVKKLSTESEALLKVAAKTEEPLDKMKRSPISPPPVNGKITVKKLSSESEALLKFTAKTEELEAPMLSKMKRSPISPPPINGKEVVKKTSNENEALLKVAAKTEALDKMKRWPISPPPINGKEIVEKLSTESEALVEVTAKTEEAEVAMLDEMKVIELKLLAKSRGLKAYSRLTKNELVEILKSHLVS